MRRLLALALAASGWSAGAQDFRKLPEWARSFAQLASTAPADAKAEVLLSRTTVDYREGGEYITRTYRITRILEEGGLGEAVFRFHAPGGKATRLKWVKGWNLRPNGEVEALDPNLVVKMDADTSGSAISTATVTGAVLPRVVVGSLVAFESEQVQRPVTGPFLILPIPGEHPVRHWELEVASRGAEVRLDVVGTLPGLPQPQVEPLRKLVFRDLPALPQEDRSLPHWRNFVPYAFLRFIDPKAPPPGLNAWDDIARWTAGLYPPASSGQPTQVGEVGPEALTQLLASMSRDLTYRQVYLSEDRGWRPEAPLETQRRRYGDCKDLAYYLISQGQLRGWEGYPALARIQEGRLEASELPNPAAFNHVIAAIRLPKPLGLPAETVAKDGTRYLLVDPTSRLTRTGFLDASHRGRKVLLCRPSGGEWLSIPDSAIDPERIEAVLDATAPESAPQALDGTLTIQESGDSWGLRSFTLQAGPSRLRDHLLAGYLTLPPTGALDLVRAGDPLDLSKPFEVVLRIRHPEGFRRTGGEALLANILLPEVPPALVKTGRTRQLPIESSNHKRLEVALNLTLPGKVEPILRDHQGASAFRDLSWSSRLDHAGTHTRLHLKVSNQRKAVLFGYADLGAGVAEWKKDRALVRKLIEEALTLKVLP